MPTDPKSVSKNTSSVDADFLIKLNIYVSYHMKYDLRKQGFLQNYTEVWDFVLNINVIDDKEQIRYNMINFRFDEESVFVE